MRKNKFGLVTLFSMLALSLCATATFAYASWQFNKDETVNDQVNIGIPTWDFGIIQPDDVITVNNDGTITINGKPAEDAEVTYPKGEEPETHGGSITYNIGLVDGEVVVTSYEATNIASTYVWWSSTSTVSFPESVIINGQELKIIGISEPVTIGVDKEAFTSPTVDIVVPEGYKYVCDEAFKNIVSEGFSVFSSTTFNITLPSTLNYLGNQSLNVNLGSNTNVNIIYKGSKEQFKALVDNSKAKYGSSYNFLYNATGNVTIQCSKGSIVYTKNGEYKSGL